MRLDFKSLAFGYKLTDGVSTPAWETSLGQGAGYKINDSRTINELIKGMIYKMVPPKSVSFKKGRGGTIVKGDADNASFVSAAVFDKVFINEHQILNGKFILLIVKDDSESHKGRLKLKYGLDNAYESDDGAIVKNRDFQNIAATQLGLAENACWFIYDISVENQDVLRLSAIFVNKDDSETYANSAALHNAWDSLIEEDVSAKHNSHEADALDDSYSQWNDIFNNNLYGVHIKLQNDALSDTKPHICIGWSAMGDLTGVATKEDLASRYEVTWPNEKARKKGQDIGQIWRFINEMQIGDYVIFADGDVCHIGRITSDYYFDNSENPNQDSDYANIRDVEWLQKDIRKSDLSEVFQNSLGAAMSVFRLNDYKSALNDLLNDTYVKDELLLEEIEEEDIFSGFEPWLTSPNNPDYTGKQKYGGYARAIVKLVDFMYGKNLIEDTDLNDNNIEKYTYWVEIYDGSDEAKDFDVNKNSNKAGSAALKKYIKYIKYLTTPHIVDFDYSITKNTSTNMIFYGVPGCGKSYHIQHNVLGITPYVRTTFYQDYSNTDFVGQILPKVVKGEGGGKDTVEYIFNPGPFTLALIQAISNPTEKVALVIEEINRGNAPAIFGDIFQLLDRGEDGISEYGIKNVGVIDYLNAYEFTVDGEKKRYHFDEIKIPGNLAIYATMNTSDQNVYTLDTAFTRRWSKERIENKFGTNKIKDMYVPGMTSCTWGTFVDKVNIHIRSKIDELQVNEDKQVGCFFVKKSDLLVKDEADGDKKKAKLFAYKVLEYLWDDVSKLDHSVIFAPHYTTFEDLVKDYLEKGVEVFNGEIFK